MTRTMAVYVATLWAPGVAQATYSICATDSETRLVGGSGASCVAPQSVYVIYGSAPSHGVVHAQALANEAGRDDAVRRLNNDEAPVDIIAAITAPAFDPLAQARQYGIADLMGRAAGFTGSLAQAYAEDRQGAIGAFTYSVQGNILTGADVIDQAIDGFENRGGCDLADRLMHAIEAGAENGQGDTRCTPSGIAANSAFIQVDRGGEPAGSYLFIEVTDASGADPLVELRTQFDAWRVAHPCPVSPDGGMPDMGIDAPADLGMEAGLPDAAPDVAPDAAPDVGAADLPPPEAGADPGRPDVASVDIGTGPDASIGSDDVLDGANADLGGTVDASFDSASPSDGLSTAEDDGLDAPSGDRDGDRPGADGGESSGCACVVGADVPPNGPLSWIVGVVVACLSRRKRVA